MIRLLKRFATLLVIALVIFTAWQWAKGYFKIQTNPDGENLKGVSKNTAVANFDALLVQEDVGQNKKRILRCNDVCTPEKIPTSTQDQPLTNGTNWFYYTTAPTKAGESATQLVVSSSDPKEKPKIIAAETDLIKPRGIFLSPGGDKLAYFLDNVHEPEKNLTEIWVYDNKSGAVSLIAENIHRPDMMTRLRWNAAGTQLWFVANSGTEEKPKIEFITLNASTQAPKASFTTFDWDELKDIADKGIMDIATDGNRLAYGKPTGEKSDKLIMTSKNGQQLSASMPGTIPYIEWLPDNTLIYAVQADGGFSFWRAKDDRATLISEEDGVLRSAHRNSDGDHIIFAADTAQGNTKLFSLNINAKAANEEETIPAFGNHVFVVQVTPREGKEAAVAGATTALSDAEVAGFIDTHIADITRDTGAQKSKIIITNQPNTALLEYISTDGQRQRLALSIQDAINPEWSVNARYEDVSGVWQATQTSYVTDPKPLRLYEWEEDQKQWILKQTYAQ